MKHICVLNVMSSLLPGKTGQVFMDHQGDREPNYWVKRYDDDEDRMVPFARVQMSKPPGEVN